MSTTPIVRSIRILPKTSSELDRLTGNRGEIFFDSNSSSLRVFDSLSRGGVSLLKSDLSNISGGGSTANNVNFGTRTVQSAGFIGNVTGTVSSLANHNLDALANVDVATATDGQILFYEAATSSWKATSLASTFNGGTITAALSINNVTPSVNSSTGALRVTGGVGIGGALHVGTTITAATSMEVTGGPLMVRANNRLRLYDADNTNFVGLRSPINLTADVTYVLPGVDGTTGQVLQTNGSGVLSWRTVTSDGGGGSGVSNPPGGANTFVQFNDNTTFGGVSTFTYDSALDVVGLTSLLVGSNINGADVATIDGVASITLVDGATVTEFSTDGTMSSNSDAKVPTELAVKTYISSAISSKANSNSPTFTGTVTASTVVVNAELTVADNVTANNNIVINKLPTATNHATNKRYVDVRSVAMSIALS